MGRRRKHREEDDDDLLERNFSSKRYHLDLSSDPESTSHRLLQNNPPSLNDSDAVSTRTIVGVSTTKDSSHETVKANKRRLKKERQRLKKQQLQSNKDSNPASPKKEPLNFHERRLGVRFADIVVGNGPAARDRKKVHVKYTLRSSSMSGKILDRSQHFGFRLGKGEVILGWDIGMVGMKCGGTRQLIVPPEAGYGKKNVGAGVNGTLFFEIVLLSCA